MSDARLKILSLPDLQLTDDEWLEISGIISSLEYRTLEAFKISFIERKSDTVIRSKNIFPLFVFITAWFDITHWLITWINHLNAVWAQVANNNMSADNLIPLLIELLPNDEPHLKTLQKKIELALQIKNMGETECYLTNLLIAVSAKIISLTESPIQPEKMIFLVANEERKLEQIAYLTPVCTDYKDYLRDTFLVLFQSSDTDKDNYQKCLELCRIETNEINKAEINKTELMNILIENLGSKIILQNPQLTPLLEKYFVLHEIQITLLRMSNSPTDKLIEFSAKYHQHYEILTKNLNSSTRTFIKMANAYMGWEDAEAKFLRLAGFFSKQIKIETASEDKNNEPNMHLNH